MPLSDGVTTRLGLKNVLGERGIHLAHDVLFFVAHLLNLGKRGRQLIAPSNMLCDRAYRRHAVGGARLGGVGRR